MRLLSIALLKPTPKLIDRAEINHLNEISPEIQLGLGYRINEQATINLSYQTIFGKNTQLTVDPQNETGILSPIPSQQAIMIGFSFDFL